MTVDLIGFSKLNESCCSVAMQSMKVAEMIYIFGNHFECDASDETLRQEGITHELEPDVFRLLLYLLEHCDQVVTKAELIDNLWPDETVSLDGVTRYVRAVRRVIGDDGYRQEMIKTVRGEGYRFLPEVEVRESSQPTAGITYEPLVSALSATSGQVLPADAVTETMSQNVAESVEMGGGTSSEPISRSISLSRQYYQAGLGILNYVGTILRQRYPDRSIKVRVEQNHQLGELMIRLLVEAPDDMRATIERDLELYGLVVVEQMVPEELLPNPMDVQALRRKLDLIRTELSLEREHLLSSQRSGQLQQERVTSLGTDVAEFHRLITAALGQMEELIV